MNVFVLMLHYCWCVWVAGRREREDERKEKGNGAAFEWQNCVQFNGATLSRFFSGHIGTNEGLTLFTSTPDWDPGLAASYISLWGEKVHSCPICTSQGEERIGHPLTFGWLQLEWASTALVPASSWFSCSLIGWLSWRIHRVVARLESSAS